MIYRLTFLSHRQANRHTLKTYENEPDDPRFKIDLTGVARCALGKTNSHEHCGIRVRLLKRGIVRTWHLGSAKRAITETHSL
jgi:hypothetical protein